MTKKRLVKKVVALVATAMMLVGMVIPAMASGVTYADKGTITVHKYAGNQGGVLPNTTGAELATTDGAHPLNNGYSALAGAEFTLYKVTSLTGVMAKLKTGETITSTVVVPGAPPSVKYTFSNGDELTEGTTFIGTNTTVASGQAVFGSANLADGVYVLVETDTPTGYKPAAPSIIRLPLTDKDGEYNYDVHVYPKNVSNTNIVKKDIAGVLKPVTKNDIINFELKAKFLSDTVTGVSDLRNGAVYGSAVITETFSSYFDLEESPGVKAYWLDTDGEIDTTAPIAAAHVTISTLPTGAGGSFTATLTTLGIDQAITSNKAGFGLTLSAKYIGAPSAATGDTANRIENTMYAKILKAGESDPDPEDPGTQDKTFVPSISIKVDKDQSNGSPLPGVAFALAKVAVPKVNLEVGKALNTYSSADIALIEAEYVLNAAGEPLVAITDANGFVLFSNLDGYSNDTGATFYLKELATVAGYRLRVPSIEVNFKTQAQYKTAHSDWFDGNNWKENANVTEAATVVNYKLEEPGGGEEPGFSLPLTGGAGTIAFTVAGIVLMLGAAVLIVRKKKEA